MSVIEVVGYLFILSGILCLASIFIPSTTIRVKYTGCLYSPDKMHDMVKVDFHPPGEYRCRYCRE